MRVGIIGAGAMGTLFAHALAAHHEVTLLDTRKDVVDAIAAHGVAVDNAPARKVTAVHESGTLHTSNALFVFVKAQHTLQALRPFARRLDPSTPIISLQNGLGHDEAIKTALGVNIPLVLGVTNESCIATGYGRSHRISAGTTIVGSGGASQTAVRSIEAIFDKAGLPATVAYDIRSHLWGKLIANAAINPTAALLDQKNGILLADQGLRRLAQVLAEEGATVAKALRINLPFGDVWEYVRGIIAASADAENSMTTDLRAHRQTEIEQINGAIVAAGRKAGIPTPCNEAILSLLKAKEAL
jgi:2-dehydropantoate 2-reductase